MSAAFHAFRTTLAAAPALALALLAASAPTARAADATTWSADRAHTEVNFSVKHFFTPVTGSFEDFSVDLRYDAENPEKSSVEVRIKVASVNTGNEKRDAHLATADWFEADRYPEMTFKSTSVRQAGEGRLIATGPLTIKGRSHQVELPITLLGKQAIEEPMRAMLGGTREVASFQATTSLDRGDFGVGTGSWAATMVVGGQVDVEILLEAHAR